jgi:ABC-2 type transport system ATP-binding protein
LSPQPVVEFDGVSKFFGGVVAVSDVSFTIEPGVTALLGPNGAGKSTVMRMLCGLAAPSRGRVRLLGKNPRGAVDVFRHLGLVPQQEVVPEVLSAHEFVTLSAELSQVRGADTAARRALGLVELDHDDPRPVRTYSKGMRQRVKVAAALVHDPDIVVLDEPLEGLDPRQRRHMISLFTQLGEQERTVIVSSHVLDEIERLASRVLVMGKGRLLAVGDFHAIRELIDDRPHKLRVVTDKPRELAAGIMADAEVVGVSIVRGNVVVDTTDVAVFRTSIAAIAKQRNARLMEVVPLDDDLESVFRYLVGAS